MRAGKVLAVMVVLAAVFAFSSSVEAAPEKRIRVPEEKKGEVSLPWEEFKNLIDWQHLREAYEEGIISLPWKEIHEILKLETEPLEKATVKLPWQEFKKMLVWSLEKKLGPKPPQDYVISRALFDGRATKEGADFTLSATIYVLDEEKWLTIPLLPATVAVKEAELPDGSFLSLFK